MPKVNGKWQYSAKPVKSRAHKILDQIIDEISKQEGIPARQVSDILQYTYGYIVSKIREGKAEGVRIPYWGAFAVKPKQRIRLKEYIEKYPNEEGGAEHKRKRIFGKTKQKESRTDSEETSQERSSDKD